ncbi:MAG: metallopeptidase family protein [Pseudomonadota bacterium]
MSARRADEPEEGVEDLLEHAELALDSGDPEIALEACRRLLSRHPRHADALYLLGESYRDLGAYEEALESYRRCVLADPHHAGAWAALGSVYLLLLQLEEARRALHRAIREDPTNPEAFYARALVRERSGDLKGSDRDLARAARLDPTGYPFPVPLDDTDLEAAVNEVLESLHPTLQEYLANVAILVEEIPSDEILRQYDPPVSPGELLGYFSGASLLDRSVDDPWSHLPSAIILFRRSMQRYAQSHEQLIEELSTTIYHEVGHFLGLDEDDLKARGLE